jgi:glycosyltransferase involved in cell wall biosynthesis
MNIGIDIRCLTTVSGIPVYVENILKELEKIDISNNYHLFEIDGVDYIPTNKLWNKILIKSPIPLSISMHFLFPYYFKKLKLDLFISFDFTVPIWFVKKTKRFVVVHDLSYLHFPKTMLWKRRFTNKLFTPISMKISSSVITVSNYMKKDILNNYPNVSEKKISIIPSSSSNWKLPDNYDAKKRNRFLLFVGNFEPRKNILNLIKALEVLKEEASFNEELHIVGPKGWNNQTIFEYISKSNFKDNIIFRGFLSQDELISAYCSCKAFVFPSLYEGFGIPILEALNSDCLIITSKGSAMQETLGDAAIYADPTDPRDIAKAIKSIYEPAFDREKYLSLGKKIVQQYSWNKSAQLLYSLITKCV